MPICNYCGVEQDSVCRKDLQARDCMDYAMNPIKPLRIPVKDTTAVGVGEPVEAPYAPRKPEDTIEDTDFGFSFLDEDAEKLQTLRDEQQDLAGRLDKLYHTILPFLDNLAANPEKPTIHWPNRDEKIKAFKRKLKAIKEGK